jgi:hypothetical protein
VPILSTVAGCDVIWGLQRADRIQPDGGTSGTTTATTTTSTGTAGGGGSGGHDAGCGFGPDAAPPLCPSDPLWSKQFGTSAHPTGVAVDGQGNVVAAGSFQSTIDFGGGPIASAGAGDVFVAKFDGSGNYVWASRFGDAMDQFAGAIAVDGTGNVLVGGAFQGTLFFNSTLQSAGAYDAFVAKLSPSGGSTWGIAFGGPANDGVNGVAVDGAGDVFVAGAFQGSMVLAGQTLTAMGASDVFVAKLDPSGAPKWSKSFGGTSSQRSSGITVDNAGDLIVVGQFVQSIAFCSTPLMIGGGAFAGFVAKLDANGNCKWSKGFGDGVDDVENVGVAAVDSANNVFLTGSFKGSINLGGKTLTAAGASDVFVAKIDSGGNHLWSKSYGNAAAQTGYAAATDHEGNVFVTGGFAGSIDFGGDLLPSAGQDDVFVAKLDGNGNRLWSKAYGDPSVQDAYAIATDKAGDAVVAGVFSGAIDFGGGPLTTKTPTDVDMFLAKLAP